MLAAQIDRLGPPNQIHIRDVKRPIVGPRDVLLRVTHSSVNHVDTFVRSGAWQTSVVFPLTIGRDAVGVVEEIGVAVRGVFELGDRVWTNSLGYAGRDGATAEFVTAEASRVYHVPEAISSAHMAALCHPGATAQLALFRHGNLKLGEHVVIVGAGGCIGKIMVQLAVAAGARVTAVARMNHNCVLRDLGANNVLDLEAVQAQGLQEPADLIIDTAGDNDLKLWSEQARYGGRILLIAGMESVAALPVGTVYLKSLNISGFSISQMGDTELAEAARGLCQAISDGLLPPPIVLRPLEEVALAHIEIEAGTIRGKQVIEIVPKTPWFSSTELIPAVSDAKN